MCQVIRHLPRLIAIQSTPPLGRPTGTWVSPYKTTTTIRPEVDGMVEY